MGDVPILVAGDVQEDISKVDGWRRWVRAPHVLHTFTGEVPEAKLNGP